MCFCNVYTYLCCLYTPFHRPNSRSFSEIFNFRIASRQLLNVCICGGLISYPISFFLRRGRKYVPRYGRQRWGRNVPLVTGRMVKVCEGEIEIEFRRTCLMVRICIYVALESSDMYGVRREGYGNLGAVGLGFRVSEVTS
jgi:hypothetical protein